MGLTTAPVNAWFLAWVERGLGNMGADGRAGRMAEGREVAYLGKPNFWPGRTNRSSAWGACLGFVSWWCQKIGVGGIILSRTDV